MTIDEAIKHCLEVAEQQEADSFIDRWSDDDEWSERSSVYLLDCEPKGGRLVGYGNPPRDETFSKDKRPNPFYDSRNDGFIFLISDEWRRIELLIIPNGYNTVLGNAKALQDGVYDEALETMRKAATPFFEY